MLNIKKRIKLIEEFLLDDTAQSLTYAALESRLTLEYLCYERFKSVYAYLSLNDLKNWQPKHVVKQVSEEIDPHIAEEFTLSIAKESTPSTSPTTLEEFEAMEYLPVGTQSALNLKQIHRLWNGLSSVALHIPVPSIGTGQLQIYQDKEKIRKKVESTINLLSKIEGNLLMSGPFSEVFSFECLACGMTAKRPLKSLEAPTVVNCINPNCIESYVLTPSEEAEDIEITRRVIRFMCEGCNDELEVPSSYFRDLKFEQQLDIKCGSCESRLRVIMRPLVKVLDSEDSHNKQKQADA
tara:strand:- start:30232 stop:31116 length:885 start_codon:yes stop_codon:yes gene_type:complete